MTTTRSSGAQLPSRCRRPKIRDRVPPEGFASPDCTSSLGRTPLQARSSVPFRPHRPPSTCRSSSGLHRTAQARDVSPYSAAPTAKEGQTATPRHQCDRRGFESRRRLQLRIVPRADHPPPRRSLRPSAVPTVMIPRRLEPRFHYFTPTGVTTGGPRGNARVRHKLLPLLGLTTSAAVAPAGPGHPMPAGPASPARGRRPVSQRRSPSSRMVPRRRRCSTNCFPGTR